MRLPRRYRPRFGVHNRVDRDIASLLRNLDANAPRLIHDPVSPNVSYSMSTAKQNPWKVGNLVLGFNSSVCDSMLDNTIVWFCTIFSSESLLRFSLVWRFSRVLSIERWPLNSYVAKARNKCISPQPYDLHACVSSGGLVSFARPWARFVQQCGWVILRRAK